jgi:hypothetical protein
MVEKSCIASLEPIPVVKGKYVHFLCIFGLWGELLKKIGWTRFGNRWDRFWLLSMHKSRGSVPWLGGSCICAGRALVWVLPWLLWWFAPLCELAFVSVVLIRCPCLRGPRLSSFKWSCSLPLLAFDRLFEYLCSFLFFFLFSSVTKCVCCQCTHQDRDWEPVWFEDRWMLASWCDEWLTTLCGLTLG